MKILIVRSSHKNSNKKETNSVFLHFCPGLRVLKTRWAKFAKQHCDGLQTRFSFIPKGLKLGTHLQESEQR